MCGIMSMGVQNMATTQNTRFLYLVASATLSVSLFGCSSAISEPEEILAKSYTDISQLKDDFIAAGGVCDIWEQTNKVTAALQSGDCGSKTVLSLFSSKEAAESAALELKNLMINLGTEPSLLLGENWLINSPDVRKVQPKLGGLLILDSADSPTGDDDASQAEKWSTSESCAKFTEATERAKGATVLNQLIVGTATLDEVASQMSSDESLFKALVPKIGDAALADMVQSVASAFGDVGRAAQAASKLDESISDALTPLIDSMSLVEDYCAIAG